MLNSCNVVHEGCLAPPALAFTGTQAVCFRCGNYVCTNCSRRVRYQRYGRRRLCDHCRAELKRCAKA
jgi:hypothetical protein